MRLRIHSLADHPALIPLIGGWHFQEWGHHTPGATRESWTAALTAHRAFAIPTTWVALLEGDVVAGCASLLEHDMTSRDDLTPWLASVFVAPEWRGKGVGRALVRHAMRGAAALGVPALYLYTNGAEAFYDALGWRVVGREPYEGRTVTIMATVPGASG